MQATQPYTKIRKMGVPSEERVVLRCVASSRLALVPCFALRFCPQPPGWGFLEGMGGVPCTKPSRRNGSNLTRTRDDLSSLP